MENSTVTGKGFWHAGLLSDFRIGLRLLIKNPALTLSALCALTLGVGVNTAVFSVVNATLLRPLAFKQPERLVVLWRSSPTTKRGSVSAPEFIDWTRRQTGFERITATAARSFSIQSQDDTEVLGGATVSANFFETIGVQPAYGRTFRPSEDRPGNDAVVVLSYKLWRRSLGGSLKVIGTDIIVNRERRTVIGIMPPDFDFPNYSQGPSDLWVPLAFSQAQLANRGTNFIFVIGKLGDGVTLAQANSKMNLIARQLGQQYPVTDAAWTVSLVPLQSALVASFRPALLILSCAVAFILIIACANIASTLLAQAVSRESEMAIRIALGGSRFRLIRQWLVQGLILSTVGGMLAFLAVVSSTGLLTWLSTRLLPQMSVNHLDGPVMLFAATLSMLAGIAFGVAPACHRGGADIQSILRSQGRSNSVGASKTRMRDVLVIGQIAVVMLLSIGAGLMLKSLWQMRSVDSGLNAHDVLTVRVTMPPAEYPDVAACSRRYQQILSDLSSIPGVRAVGLINLFPLEEWGVNGSVDIEGRSARYGNDPMVEYRAVDPNYFRTLKIPLISGRFLTDRDGVESPHVVLVNQAFARLFWTNESPINKGIRFSSPVWVRVIGVVGDVRQVALNQQALPEFYMPYAQASWTFLVQSATMVIRGDKDVKGLVGPVRRAIKAIDPDLAISNVQTVSEIIDKRIGPTRLYTFMIILFAGLALSLTLVGVYGVVSYGVAERTQEIGIRMALGAQHKEIFRILLGRVFSLTMVGAGIGLALALMLGRLVAGFVYNVKVSDPAIIISASLVVVAMAVIASFIPARRAASISPLEAIRES